MPWHPCLFPLWGGSPKTHASFSPSHQLLWGQPWGPSIVELPCSTPESCPQSLSYTGSCTESQKSDTHLLPIGHISSLLPAPSHPVLFVPASGPLHRCSLPVCDNAGPARQKLASLMCRPILTFSPTRFIKNEVEVVLLSLRKVMVEFRRQTCLKKGYLVHQKSERYVLTQKNYKCTHHVLHLFKVGSSLFSSPFTLLCNYDVCLIPEHSIPLKRDPVSITVTPISSPSP